MAGSKGRRPATVAPRPAKPEARPRGERRSVNLAARDAAALEQEAKARGVTVSALLAGIVGEWLMRNLSGHVAEVTTRPELSAARAKARALELRGRKWERRSRKRGPTCETIAATLNREGYRTKRGRPFTGLAVWRLLS